MFLPLLPPKRHTASKWVKAMFNYYTRQTAAGLTLHATMREGSTYALREDEAATLPPHVSEEVALYPQVPHRAITTQNEALMGIDGAIQGIPLTSTIKAFMHFCSQAFMNIVVIGCLGGTVFSTLYYFRVIPTVEQLVSFYLHVLALGFTLALPAAFHKALQNLNGLICRK